MGTCRKASDKKLIFVDSNIWCYYFDQRVLEHRSTLEPMREIIKHEEIACNTIIIMEVAHYIVRHFNENSARKKIDFLVNLRNIKISDFNRQMMQESLESLLEFSAYGLGGRDATIIATLKSQNIKRIITHDTVFKRLAEKLALEVVDPISSS
jgi:predicted nucleic acid-binding protein